MFALEGDFKKARHHYTQGLKAEDTRLRFFGPDNSDSKSLLGILMMKNSTELTNAFAQGLISREKKKKEKKQGRKNKKGSIQSASNDTELTQDFTKDSSRGKKKGQQSAFDVSKWRSEPC